MSAPWFRTTDLTRWGTANSGGDLSAAQFDDNTWWAYSNITALLARPTPSEIDHFVLVGDQLTVIMSDHTTRGPYTIPTSAFRFRGDWQPNTVYLVNDVFTINGSTYIVIFSHTSQATFSAGANDGLGHNYYGLMLSNPGNSLPTGGAAGQMVTKSITGTDFAVTWDWPLPTGGTADQLLMKNSNTNQDASWKTSPFVWAPPVSPPATGGEFLQTVDGTFRNTVWAIPPYVSKPASNGSATQVLATIDGTSDNTEWVDQSSGGGSTTLAGLTDVSIPSSPTPTHGDQLVYSRLNKWANRLLQNNNLSITSGNIIIDPVKHPIYNLQPNGDCSLDNSNRSGYVGEIVLFSIFTDGTPYNITFSSGDFKGAGTLSTGSVANKFFHLSFMAGDDGVLYEMNRYGPF